MFFLFVCSEFLVVFSFSFHVRVGGRSEGKRPQRITGIQDYRRSLSYACVIMKRKNIVLEKPMLNQFQKSHKHNGKQKHMDYNASFYNIICKRLLKGNELRNTEKKNLVSVIKYLKSDRLGKMVPVLKH